MSSVRIWNAYETFGIKQANSCQWELSTAEREIDGCKRVVLDTKSRDTILKRIELQPPSEAFATLEIISQQSLCKFCAKHPARHRQLIVAWKLRLSDALRSYVQLCLKQQRSLAEKLEECRKIIIDLDKKIEMLDETGAHPKITPTQTEGSQARILTIKAFRDQNEKLVHKQEMLLSENKKLTGQLESQNKELEVYKAKESELESYKSEVLILRSRLKEWSDFGENMKKNPDKGVRSFLTSLQVLQSDNKGTNSSDEPKKEAFQFSSFDAAKGPYAKGPNPKARLPYGDYRIIKSVGTSTQTPPLTIESPFAFKAETGTDSVASRTTPVSKASLSENKIASSGISPSNINPFTTPASTSLPMHTTKGHSNQIETTPSFSLTVSPVIKGDMFGTTASSFGNGSDKISSASPKLAIKDREVSSSTTPASEFYTNWFKTLPAPANPFKNASIGNINVFATPSQFWSSTMKSEPFKAFQFPPPTTKPSSTGPFGGISGFSKNPTTATPDKPFSFSFKAPVPVEKDSTSNSRSVLGIKTPNESPTASSKKGGLFGGGIPHSGMATPLFEIIPHQPSTDSSSAAGKIFGNFTSDAAGFRAGSG
ncbi:hypothetical protein DSL72_004798 [Monilinia vaccinii-corymbosi]|uniref:Uncharacterized protein n=1 Tax=Monilinia vaccinii-corymbosi TaxID=61207 RepID=A0A8A3P4P3_9HELO|nr:hypothetical protein DSL72_004798 [Monilinia vaccinii-corymbosi]